MKRTLLLVLSVLGLSLFSHAQLIKKKMPRTLTNGLDEEYAPYVSAFGNMMLMSKPNLVTDKLEIVFSQKKKGTWMAPEEVGTINKAAQLLHRGGYSLTPDGSKMYFTWKKHGGVGQFDIWEATFDGKTWASMRNIGMPVNSVEDEYCPTISGDGKTFMFLRSTGVSFAKPKPGKLFTSELIGTDTWTAPTVPKGFENRLVYAPRLLADGQTIVYTMEKGGALKFFKSVKRGDRWSEPISLEFLDDQNIEPHLSGSIHTGMLYTSIKGSHSHDIYKVKFPEALSPAPITFVEGSVRNLKTNKPVESFIQVYDESNWERLFVQRTNREGDFNLILPSGTAYNVYVQESSLNHTFYSKSIDLRQATKFSRKTINAKLEKLTPGVSLFMERIAFKPYTSEFESYSLQELERLESLLKSNGALQLRIAAFNKNYKSDSIRSDKDLTELIVDTLITQKEVIDSILIVQDNPIDSVMNKDSVMVVKEVEPQYTIQKRTVEVRTIKKTYHNDRTDEQAKVIYQYFIDNGIPKNRISYKGYSGDKVNKLKGIGTLEEGVLIMFK